MLTKVQMQSTKNGFRIKNFKVMYFFLILLEINVTKCMQSVMLVVYSLPLFNYLKNPMT